MNNIATSGIFWIGTCIVASVTYNLLRKYLGKDLSPKVMIIFLYVFGLITALIIGGLSGREIWQGITKEIILLLACTGVAIYLFQYSSVMAVKLGLNMAIFRMITSVGYIIILFFLESILFHQKITLQQLLGCGFGAIALYLLLIK